MKEGDSKVIALTCKGCSATTSILCSAYLLTYSYTFRGVTGMLTPPARSSTCRSNRKHSDVQTLNPKANAKGKCGHYLSSSFLLAEVNSKGKVHCSKHSLRLLGLRMPNQLPQALVHHRVKESEVVPVHLQHKRTQASVEPSDVCHAEIADGIAKARHKMSNKCTSQHNNNNNEIIKIFKKSQLLPCFNINYQ